MKPLALDSSAQLQASLEFCDALVELAESLALVVDRDVIEVRHPLERTKGSGTWAAAGLGQRRDLVSGGMGVGGIACNPDVCRFTGFSRFGRRRCCPNGDEELT